MARSDIRLRVAVNELLDYCSTVDIEQTLPSEIELAETLNCSRTIVRSALGHLKDQGILDWEGRKKILLRKPTQTDRMPVTESFNSPQELESEFLDWVLRFDIPPNTPLNVTQLARQFSVIPQMLQQFLAELSRYGIVDRRPRGGWLLRGFTKEFAVELSDFRTLLELNAVQQFIGLPDTHAAWQSLNDIEDRHHALLQRIDVDYHDFSKLDEDLHNLINSVVENRFTVDFQKVISLIFHYHFQWNKSDERARNEAAIHEHLTMIRALKSRRSDDVRDATLLHLETAKQTLLSALRANQHV